MNAKGPNRYFYADRWFLFLTWCSTAFTPTNAMGQGRFPGLFRDLVVVEKESASAKEVRLKWIDDERNRIREELRKYRDELAELEKSFPDPVKARILSPAEEKEQRREQLRFNDWASNNDPAMKNAIIRGEGLNALLRVLGPIAHYRRMRSDGVPIEVFPSLAPEQAIPSDHVAHYRLNPATSAGSRVVIRLNQLPLSLEWPTVVQQYWKADCANIGKTCNAYVTLLSIEGDGIAHVETAELLDKSLSLLQAKIQESIRQVFRDPLLNPEKRYQMQRDRKDAIRYIETVRATAERFKKAPSDYKVRRFAGGSIEEFLDFCYTHGMIFQSALPADEDYYRAVFVKMKNYAYDIQFVENWKSDIAQRIRELNAEDKRLLWEAAEQ